MKYKSAIAERMKERQIERGKQQAEFLNNNKSGSNEPLLEKSTKRKELAKIAGTSEGSIKQKKLPHGVASFLCLCRRSDPPGTATAAVERLPHTEKPVKSMEVKFFNFRDLKFLTSRSKIF